MNDLKRRFPIGFYGVNIYDDNDKDGIWNSILWVDNKMYRERVETLILSNIDSDEPKVFIGPPNRRYPAYRIPGGSTERDITHEEAAIKECKEEAKIIVKNIIKCGEYKNPKYMKEMKLNNDSNMKLKYEGSYVHIFVAEYDKSYNGFIAEVDRDPYMANKGKFMSLSTAWTLLSKEHKDAINKYIGLKLYYNMVSV